MSNSKSTRRFVPNNPLARRGYLRMINPMTELVKAFACPCGEIMPPSNSVNHIISCKHPQAKQGKLITIPNPALVVVQTNRGILVIEGLESEEEKSKFGPCPFPLTHSGLVAHDVNHEIGDKRVARLNKYDGDLHRGKNDDLL